jgi:hypothetical protein
MTEFKPDLPADVKLPDGHSINTAHADYKALEELATRHGWSQAAFSETLGLEAKRTMAKAAPAPAPKVDFDKRSTTQKFAHAFTTPSKRG